MSKSFDFGRTPDPAWPAELRSNDEKTFND
jgi:hypothetical protein